MRSLTRLAMVAVSMMVLITAVAEAADQTPIRIGIIYRDSGGGPPMGKSLDAAIAAYQALHGDSVAGRKIEFIKRDDGGVAPDVARRLAQELVIGDHVDFLAGSLLSPNAVAIAGVSTAAHVPFLIVNAGTSGILEKQPYTVRFGVTNVQVVSAKNLGPQSKLFELNYLFRNKPAHAMVQAYQAGSAPPIRFIDLPPFDDDGHRTLARADPSVWAEPVSAFLHQVAPAP